MPTPGQILATSLVLAFALTLLLTPTLMQPLKPFLPKCEYTAFGACVTQKNNVRPN